MKVIAFIPVRCGSTSIPFKNIKAINGKPLIYWTAATLNACYAVDEIWIGTDCEEIASVVDGLALDKVRVYHRSPENATDTASTESVMLEFLQQYPNLNPESTLVLVQATSPLLQSNHIEEALQKFSTGDFDSVLSCVGSKRFFWKQNGTPINYDYRNRPRRQDFEGWLMENGAFYIQSVHGVLSNQNRLGGKVGFYEMPDYTATELDETIDWIITEKLMQYYLPTQPLSANIRVLLTDVDGVLTDGTMYYGEAGDELKKFNTRDGMGFELLRKAGIKTGIITSENTKIVARRAAKMKADYLYQGQRDGGKLAAALEICDQEGITLEQVAYVGDDLNCISLLKKAGLAACPADAVTEVKNIPGIQVLSAKGGEGCVRELVELILGRS
jgi:N-acylneuraminate cytidylyltransferase